MATFDETLEDLGGINFLGNTLLDYMVALASIVLSFIILYGFRKVVIRRIIRSERIERNNLLRVIMMTTRKFLSNLLITVISVYIGFLALEFNAFIDSILRIVILGVIAWLAMKFFLNLLDSIIEVQVEKDEKNLHIMEFFRIVFRSLIILMVTLWFLSNLEVNVTAFLSSLGFVSLAIAFALKETISDLFASIVIFIDQPFEIGDVIKVDNVSGTVEKIGIRSTKIRSPEGFLLVASNRDLTNKKIHNLKRMDTRRVEMVIQIDQGTPISQVRSIPDMIKGIIQSLDQISFDKINLTKIGDYSYDYNLVYFVNTRDFVTHARIKQEIMLALLNKLNEENIMMPYPTQTIIVDE